MSLTKWKYEYDTPGVTSRTYVPSMLLQWHRASTLWIPLKRLAIDGVETCPDQLERLNLWISARGAWRLSSLPHFDADSALRDVLLGRLVDVPVGRAGGGRWTSSALLEQALRDGGQR